MIKVYDSNETLFNNNGLKILKPLKAEIFKEDNGEYYIDLEDKLDNLEYYNEGMIIRVPTPWGEQGFRCTNPQTNNNKIKVKALHLYYDIKNYIIADSYVVDKNCNAALEHLKSGCDSVPLFNFSSNIGVINSYRCVRNSLLNALSVVIERWGGHLVRDNFSIAVNNSIGEDRGVVLKCGKNIISNTTEEIWDNVITKILPVGKDGKLLTELYIDLEEDLYDIPYTKTISFEQDIEKENYVTEEEYELALEYDLRTRAINYLQDNKLPKINYKFEAYLPEVSDIGDLIYIKHPNCKVDITTNVISIKYDVINKKYISIEFGNFQEKKLKNLTNRIADSVTQENKKEIEAVKVYLDEDLQRATSKLWGVLGNSYVIYDGDKILVVDKLPKEEATNVILINSAGIGFSQNGINGTFKSAWTIDGTLNMQNINVINLVADMIKGGTLKLGSVSNQMGILELYDEANTLIGLLNKEGLTIYAQNGNYVKLNAENGFCGFDKNNNKIFWMEENELHIKNAYIDQTITFMGVAKFVSVNDEVNEGVGFVAT